MTLKEFVEKNGKERCVGRPDCAKFRDFKAILQDCADNKCDMIWS